MSARDDIAAVYADGTLDDAQRRVKVYRLKTAALLDVITSGGLLGRGYRHNGASYFIQRVTVDRQHRLVFEVAVNGALHTVIIVNPPLVPRAPTSDEWADMRQAVVEMLADLPTDDAP